MKLSREEVCKDQRVISCEFIYPSATSKKRKWSITSKCDKCGEITSKWFQRNTWTFMCAKCVRGRRTTPEFIAAAKEVHSDKYTYNLVNYVNNDTKVVITCPEHGTWSVRPSDFLGGSNCPVCARQIGDKAKENTKEQWSALIKNKYVTLLSKNSKDFGTFHCSKHGEFNARFTSMAKSEVSCCPTCLRLVHQPQSIRENLLGSKITIYWVYLPSIDMYKLGCTTQPVKARFSKEGKVTLLWEVQMDYEVGINFEHKVHEQFTSYRYKGSVKLIQEGTNELYHRNLFPSYSTLSTLIRHWNEKL